MSKPFGVDLHRGPEATVLSFTGELDLAVQDQVVSAVIEALGTATVVVVDLTEVAFIDSSGLNALIRSRNAARDAGRQVVLRGASGPVAQVLAITGLDAAFAGPGADDDSV